MRKFLMEDVATIMFDWLIIIMILTPLVKPEGIEYIYPILNTVVYTWWAYLAFLLAFFLAIVTLIKRKGCSLCVACITFYALFSIFNTVIHDGPLLACIRCWIRPLAVLLLFEFYRNQTEKPMRVMQVCLEILCIWNFVLMLWHPDGMYTAESTYYTQCWLLGYKSSFQYYFIPLLLIITLFREKKDEKLNYWIIWGLIHYQALAGFNAMLVVVLVIYDVIYLGKLYKAKRILNIRAYNALVIGLNVLFVFFFTFITNLSAVKYLISTLLGKTTTLLIRYNIWMKGLEAIGKNFIFGYGYTTQAEMISKFGISQVHLHNQILMILLQNGVVGLILFSILYFLVCKKLLDSWKLTSSKIIGLIFLMINLSSIVEIFISGAAFAIWPIFFFAYYAENMDCIISSNIVNTKKRFKINLIRRH